MKCNDLEKMLLLLKDVLSNNDFGKDNKRIFYLYNELEKTKVTMPTEDILEELRKIEIDLETRYEVFYELDNFFNPIYVKIKKQIHQSKIKELREKNRKKRGMN